MGLERGKTEDGNIRKGGAEKGFKGWNVYKARAQGEITWKDGVRVLRVG